jgi:hypothetical protein
MISFRIAGLRISSASVNRVISLLMTRVSHSVTRHPNRATHCLPSRAGEIYVRSVVLETGKIHYRQSIQNSYLIWKQDVHLLTFHTRSTSSVEENSVSRAL